MLLRSACFATSLMRRQTRQAQQAFAGQECSLSLSLFLARWFCLLCAFVVASDGGKSSECAQCIKSRRKTHTLIDSDNIGVFVVRARCCAERIMNTMDIVPMYEMLDGLMYDAVRGLLNSRNGSACYIRIIMIINAGIGTLRQPKRQPSHRCLLHSNINQPSQFLFLSLHILYMFHISAMACCFFPILTWNLILIYLFVFGYSNLIWFWKLPKMDYLSLRFIIIWMTNYPLFGDNHTSRWGHSETVVRVSISCH